MPLSALRICLIIPFWLVGTLTLISSTTKKLDYVPEMVYVEGGTFTMGCTEEQGEDCHDDEKESRQVTLSDFEIGKYEVTQAQWEEVMGNNPSQFKECPECPVESVSWNDAIAFIEELNRLTDEEYRLPTEAEWEYAARGGKSSNGYKYAGTTDSLDLYFWSYENSFSKGSDHPDYGTHPVGQKKANELGIHNMSGNVREWCSDWKDYYPSVSQTNPKGPEKGSSRILRGGCWNANSYFSRVSFRQSAFPNAKYNFVGFRLLKVVSP